MDESLLVQVEFKTSGANVHLVRNIVSSYKLTADLIAVKLTSNQDVQADELRRDRLERTLRAFVATGKLPTSGAD